MITGSLNLTALKHVRMKQKGKSGEVEGIFIPIDANSLKRSTKEGYNNVYLNLIAFEQKKKFENQTHLVKQSFTKEERESMENDDIPILGNLNASGGIGSDAVNDAGKGETFGSDDTVPF